MSADYSTPLLTLGEPPVPFTLRNACEGVFICGSNGAGKTSSSGAAWARAHLRAGHGFLVTTVKVDDAQEWTRHAAATGREADLIIVRPDDLENGHRFNFLEYEVSRPGRGSQITGNVVSILTNALAPGVATQLASGDRFWDDAVRKLLHCAIDTVALSGERLTLRLISEVVLSAPHSVDEARSGAFLEQSLCARLLQRAARRDDLAAPRRQDLAYAVTYWDSDFPRLSDRTRSVIEASLGGMVDGLMRSPLRELLCTDSTFSPEDTFDGKIIVLDIPTKEYGPAGRSAQLLLKSVWMRAVERRAVTPDTRPVVLFQDEAQQFLTLDDQSFAATARDRAACIVSLTQNLSGFYSAMQTRDPRAACDAYLGCLNTKVFHFNEDPTTCNFAERLFGKQWRYYLEGSVSMGGGQRIEPGSTGAQRTLGARRMEVPVMPAASLRSLRRGGHESDCKVDAVISLAGRLIRHTFTQVDRPS